MVKSVPSSLSTYLNEDVLFDNKDMARSTYFMADHFMEGLSSNKSTTWLREGEHAPEK